jgi:hypothetical protein
MWSLNLDCQTARAIRASSATPCLVAALNYLKLQIGVFAKSAIDIFALHKCSISGVLRWSGRRLVGVSPSARRGSTKRGKINVSWLAAVYP